MLEWVDIADPHDRLVRETQSRPECLVDFIRTFLPPDVVELFDLTDVERIEGEWLDDDLKKHLSDVLYRVKLKPTGAAAFVYILVEHKSEPDTGAILQLLRYAVLEWNRQWKADSSAPLPVVVPVLLYHGTRRWTASTDLAGLFGSYSATLKKYVPIFQCELVDLSERIPASMPADPLLRAGLQVLRAVGRDKLADLLTPVFRELAQQGPGAIEYARLLVTYLFHASTLGDEEFERVLGQSYPQQKEEFMPTLAQVHHERGRTEGLTVGREEGREEGLDEGRRRMAESWARRLIANRFGDQALSDARIAQLTSMPIESLDRFADVVFQLANVAELDAWLAAK